MSSPRCFQNMVTTKSAVMLLPVSFSLLQIAGMEETLALLQKELEEHQAAVDDAKVMQFVRTLLNLLTVFDHCSIYHTSVLYFV